MNGKNLLIGLSHIDRKFIEESEKDTIAKPHRSSISSRKTLLIAAVIAMMLFLMGCAVVYMMQMQDLRIGEHVVILPQQNNVDVSTAETELSLDVLSMQGIRETPVYQANQEWLAFTESYTPELGAYWQSSEEYWAYSVLDQVMADKLDEICTKYGLKLIGKPWHEHVDCTEFLKLAGIDHLLKPDSSASAQVPQGRFFPGGSFTLYGTLTTEASETPLFFTYHYVKKDVFYDVFAYVDPSTVTESSYRTADGIDLLLLESEKSGMVLADREDCFISLSIDLNSNTSLREIAEQFDFTIQSTTIDPSAADAREQASIDAFYSDDPYKDLLVRDTYGEYVEDLLWGQNQLRLSGTPEDQLPEMEYAFYDLDGNGTEELLIYRNGFIGSVVGMKNGKTDEGKSYHMTLCENNVLIDQTEVTIGETWYHIFYFANDGDPVFSNPKEQSIVRLKNADGTWWRTSSTDHYADFDTKITEEEAMDILNSYTPVMLDTRPLSQFEEP